MCLIEENERLMKIVPLLFKPTKDQGKLVTRELERGLSYFFAYLVDCNLFKPIKDQMDHSQFSIVIVVKSSTIKLNICNMSLQKNDSYDCFFHFNPHVCYLEAFL